MSARKILSLVAFLISIASVANAAGADAFLGTWVMRADNRNLFVLTLTQRDGRMEGRWDAPAKFSSTDLLFANMRGGVRHDTLVRTRLSDGVLHFTVQHANGTPEKPDEDAFAMRVNGDRATLAFDEIPPDIVVSPYVFERASSGAQVATDWEANRTYSVEDSDVPSAEMKAIFDEDQRVRLGGKVDWKNVNQTDAERRQQTRKLLASGALHTGKDYEEAAFVFQHGDSADDYLLAHTLAMVAVSKGDPTAIWISAATLDRYLEKIGQKQVFGTQYSSNPQHQWTQEPYDRQLVSDSLRKQLGVPVQALQTEQLKAYQSEK